MDKKKIVKLQLLLFVILFVASIEYYLFRENNDVFSILAAQSKNAVYSSLPTGFYDNDLKIKLSKDGLLPYRAKIFYTTNGEDPDKYSKEYSEEIVIECEKQERVIPLKVVAYYKGKYSEVQNFTYIVCKDIKERFNMPIISITTNRENLYDFDEGLFVPGTTYENAIREFDGDEYIDQTIISGNYRERNDDTWIRNAEVAMFNDEGKILNEDKIGFAISGGTSSAQYPKSLKLISNYQNELSQFEIQFLDTIEQANFSIVNYYNTIRIRSGTQSGVGGNIRSTLISELANEAQFDGCFTSKIVLVYLNGQFYGLMDMEQNYSDSFIKNKYNLEDASKVFKIKGNEKDCFKESGLDKLFEQDLTKEENQQELEKRVDIKNYLEYYAINFCINNTDWPQNNYELWYYTGDKDSNNPYTDGRARFLMYDMDMTFRTEKDGEWAEDVFQRVVKESGKAGVTGFSKLIKIKKYRDLFITILLNYKKSTFNQENIINKINSIKAYIEKESNIQFQTTGWIEDLERESDSIESASKTILSRIDKDIELLFDLDNIYEFSCSNPNGVTSRIINKTLYENESFQNKYYKGIDFEIEIIPNPGYILKNIIINGQKISQYEEKIDQLVGKKYIIKISDSLIKDNKININFEAQSDDEKTLVISEISAKDYNDWIKISNYSKEEINLSEYYLSIKENSLLLYNLPNIKLKSGESIIIDGKKNHFSIGDYICNFSISKYQTIYLTRCKGKNESQEIVDKVYVPKMQLNESYGRVHNSNIWNFFENDNSKRRK